MVPLIDCGKAGDVSSKFWLKIPLEYPRKIQENVLVLARRVRLSHHGRRVEGKKGVLRRKGVEKQNKKTIGSRLVSTP